LDTDDTNCNPFGPRTSIGAGRPCCGLTGPSLNAPSTPRLEVNDRQVPHSQPWPRRGPPHARLCLATTMLTGCLGARLAAIWQAVADQAGRVDASPRPPPDGLEEGVDQRRRRRSSRRSSTSPVTRDAGGDGGRYVGLLRPAGFAVRRPLKRSTASPRWQPADGNQKEMPKGTPRFRLHHRRHR